ncbi:MAG TPA: ABC transporter permease, partial [Lysobacter sp.]|nr:ABC transporter permease [Lysobacter sp.]
MDTLWQDVKYGARMLAKSRGVTMIAIVTLALGIGANTTVFTMLKGIILRPLPGVRAADELVVILTTSRSGSEWPMNVLDYKDIRDRNEVLAGIAGTFPAALTLGTGEKAERVWGEIVTGNLFQVLGVRPALGRLLTPDDDRVPGGSPVAVISHSLWQRKFGGDPGVIGKPLQVGTRTLTIIGVTESGYRGSMVGLSLHVFVPLMMQREVLPIGNLIESRERDNHWLLTLGRIRTGITFKQARAALHLLGGQLGQDYPDATLQERALLVPLSHSPYGSQSVLFPVFSVTMIVVGIVLLVACANLTNIMLARATVRRQEIAVRLAIGAGRGRLIRQLLTESLLLSLLGGAAG